MWSGFQLASKTIDIDRPLGDGSKVRVAYQGAPGEFSEAAALKAYPQCEAVPCEQFEVAFKVVELWLVDKAVLPIENSVEGSIHRNYDLLLCHSLHIVGEVQLSINHCLLALPGLKKVDLKRVLSHPQALGQCEIALNKLGVIRESVDDAAVAAQLIALKVLRDAGAIASAQAAEIYGLDILEENMQHVSSRLDDLARQDMITPHPSCANPLITHLAFADDLIIFVEASESNARAIKNALGSFVEISGLSASTTKSNMHMAGCYGDSMNRIQDIRIGIPIDTLPARFLGVHLIIKQLTYNDCLPLIESIQSHIHSWKAKHLSYMGRLTPYQICSTG